MRDHLPLNRGGDSVLEMLDWFRAYGVRIDLRDDSQRLLVVLAEQTSPRDRIADDDAARPGSVSSERWAARPCRAARGLGPGAARRVGFPPPALCGCCRCAAVILWGQVSATAARRATGLVLALRAGRQPLHAPRRGALGLPVLRGAFGAHGTPGDRVGGAAPGRGGGAEEGAMGRPASRPGAPCARCWAAASDSPPLTERILLVNDPRLAAYAWPPTTGRPQLANGPLLAAYDWPPMTGRPVLAA